MKTQGTSEDRPAMRRQSRQQSRKGEAIHPLGSPDRAATLHRTTAHPKSAWKAGRRQRSGFAEAATHQACFRALMQNEGGSGVLTMLVPVSHENARFAVHSCVGAKICKHRCTTTTVDAVSAAAAKATTSRSLLAKLVPLQRFTAAKPPPAASGWRRAAALRFLAAGIYRPTVALAPPFTPYEPSSGSLGGIPLAATVCRSSFLVAALMSCNRDTDRHF